jgi:hypothetical protein
MDNSNIDAGDLGYHQALVEQMAKARRLEQTILHMQEQVVRTNGACRSWFAYLRQKYDLDERASVNALGEISRPGPGES